MYFPFTTVYIQILGCIWTHLMYHIVKIFLRQIDIPLRKYEPIMNVHCKITKYMNRIADFFFYIIINFMELNDKRNSNNYTVVDEYDVS